MQFVDVLQKNSEDLVKKAGELRERINVLNANGHSGDATIKELVKTCDEIGRLSDAIKRELDAAQQAAV